MVEACPDLVWFRNQGLMPGKSNNHLIWKDQKFVIFIMIFQPRK